MNIDHHAIAIRALSRREAMKAVRADLKARGVRLFYVPMNELRALADAYLDANRAKLISQAEQIYREIYNDRAGNGMARRATVSRAS